VRYGSGRDSSETMSAPVGVALIIGHALDGIARRIRANSCHSNLAAEPLITSYRLDQAVRT